MRVSERRRLEDEVEVVTVTLVLPEKWRGQETLKLEKTNLGRSGSLRRAPSPPPEGQAGG